MLKNEKIKKENNNYDIKKVSSDKIKTGIKYSKNFFGAYSKDNSKSINNITATNTGHTDISGDVNISDNTVGINQKINILGTGTLTADASSIGGSVDNANVLNLTGGSLTQNVSNSNGTLNIKNTVSSSGIIQQGTVNIGSDDGAGTVENAVFTADGAITADVNVNTPDSEFTNNTVVTGDISNLGTITNNASIIGDISNSGTVTNNLSVTGDIVNLGTIANNGTVTGNLTNSSIFDNTSGSISGNIVNNSGTITTNANNIATATASTVTNDGVLKLTGGTLSKEVNKVSTAGSGTVEIAGDVVLNNTINDNNIKLTSGNFDVTALGDSSGNISLASASKLISGAGVIDAQDGKYGSISLGNVDTTENAVDLKVAIDADFYNLTPEKTGKLM